MAAIVYHGVQSHLETQIVESRTLRLRLPSPKPIPSQSIDVSFKSSFWDSNSNTKTNQEENKTNTNSSGCGWSFLDALSNISQGTKEQQQSQKETTYVHPHQKRSSLVLSPKSLELCTENLGNESGTDIVENGIEMLSSTSNNGGWNLEKTEQRQQPSQVVATKKAKTQSFNFPPPLTTIRGSESLRVRPHREDGRLVIEVTKAPPTSSCFQVERSHGRLRLCFLTNNTTSFDPEEEEEVEQDIPDENEPIYNEELDEEFYENEMNAELQYAEEDDNDVEEKETEEETEEEAEEKEESVACGEIMRMVNDEKRRRCKEGGENELLKWGEPLWVTTS